MVKKLKLVLERFSFDVKQVKAWKIEFHVLIIIMF